ncbi:ABC-three component system middle component 2 [uncultured Nevskia sp.]|uniref:ABC-three component system middle component 2 n=1 Tax=uncultured Nevskia sp. TaxID=228950 RepID=UPI0025E3573B|nr:ABC-three component system middle component 2 [uncultured Nevskia sp.]
MNKIPLFNSPFELGLRMVYLLNALSPAGADLQKLVLLDYAIVYSKDLGGPPSLHTPVPFRGGEVASRREMIEEGLYLMSTRGLVDVRAEIEGIMYFSGPSSYTLTGSVEAAYFLELESRCRWVSSQFCSTSSLELMGLFSREGHLWGAEIEVSSSRRGRQ